MLPLICGLELYPVLVHQLRGRCVPSSATLAERARTQIPAPRAATLCQEFMSIVPSMASDSANVRRNENFYRAVTRLVIGLQPTPCPKLPSCARVRMTRTSQLTGEHATRYSHHQNTDSFQTNDGGLALLMPRGRPSGGLFGVRRIAPRWHPGAINPRIGKTAA